MKPAQFNRTFVVAILAAASCAAQAADWSDTSLSYRYGTKFAEPFNGQDIAKNIVNLTSASGYKYGKNFFSVDFLMSDEKPTHRRPAPTAARTKRTRCTATRSTWARSAAANLACGPVRGLGATGGFDFNTKTDAGYNSKKRMMVPARRDARRARLPRRQPVRAVRKATHRTTASATSPRRATATRRMRC